MAKKYGPIGNPPNIIDTVEINIFIIFIHAAFSRHFHLSEQGPWKSTAEPEAWKMKRKILWTYLNHTLMIELNMLVFRGGSTHLLDLCKGSIVHRPIFGFKTNLVVFFFRPQVLFF